MAKVTKQEKQTSSSQKSKKDYAKLASNLRDNLKRRKQPKQHGEKKEE